MFHYSLWVSVLLSLASFAVVGAVSNPGRGLTQAIYQNGHKQNGPRHPGRHRFGRGPASGHGAVAKPNRGAEAVGRIRIKKPHAMRRAASVRARRSRGALSSGATPDGIKPVMTINHKGLPRHRIVYIKTHSTGSSTLTNIMHRYCDTNNLNCAVIPPGPEGCETSTKDGMLECQEWLEKKGQNVDIWPNHAIFVPDVFNHIVPRNVKVSIFRQPLARIMSAFAHPNGQELTAEEIKNALHKISRDEPFSLPTADPMLEQVSLENFDHLDFVLLKEEYDLGLVLLRRFLGWQTRDIMYVKLREHKKSADVLSALAEVEKYVTAPVSSMTTTGRAFIKRYFNEDEMALYNKARIRFKQQYDSLTPSEQAEVKQEVMLLRNVRKEIEACCLKVGNNDGYCKSLNEDELMWSMRKIHNGDPFDVDPDGCISILETSLS